MSNEAILITRLEHPLDMTVADGTGIEKGALLKMTDPNTASAADGTNDIIAGISAREKVASDGRTQLSVYKRGIFRMYASGNITVGDPVGSVTSWTNYVASNVNTPNLSGLKTLGHALETATTGEQFLVLVDVQYHQ